MRRGWRACLLAGFDQEREKRRGWKGRGRYLGWVEIGIEIEINHLERKKGREDLFRYGYEFG